MQTQSLQLDTEIGKVWITFAGRGPIVLYIHGWAHSGLRWKLQPPFISELFTHVTVDLPGFGTSVDISPSKANLSFYGHFVHNIATLVSAHFDQPIQAIVGHSLGGLATLNAFPFPDSKSNPRSLILFDTSFTGIAILKPLIVLYPFLVLLMSFLRILPHWLAFFLVRLGSLPTTFKWKAMDDAFVKDVLIPKPRLMIATLFAVAFGRIDLAQRPDAEHIFIARGRWDWIMTTRTLRQYAKAWNAETKTFPRAGHTPHLETPHVFYKWLDCILTKRETRSGNFDAANR